MTHPLVEQLRFTRSEWRRAHRGVPEADGLRRFEPMNSIGWIVGHMAWHEQRYWLTRLAGETPHSTQPCTEGVRKKIWDGETWLAPLEAQVRGLRIDEVTISAIVAALDEPGRAIGRSTVDGLSDDAASSRSISRRAG